MRSKLRITFPGYNTAYNTGTEPFNCCDKGPILT